MSKVWSDFFDYVLLDVPGCGQDVATIAIRNATLDFFDNAGVYAVTATPINVVAGTATYTLGAAAGWDTAWVKTVWYNGYELIPAGEDQLRQKYQNWTTESGTPRYYMHEDQNTIRLVPNPDTSLAGGLTMRAVLKPTRASTGFSTDWVFDRWVEVIAHGAKAQLMAMPAKPWTNPAMSTYHEGMYKSGLDDAMRDINRSLTRAKLVMKMRPAA